MPSQLSSDVFVLPSKRGFTVYAPLAGRIVLANGSCVAELQRYLETGDPKVVSPEVTKRLGGLGWLEARPKSAPLPGDRHFHPSHVILFLTNRCNLRCRYCYAQAGENEASQMPAEIYEAAIDLALHNARRAGRPPQIGFHGGGEPTVAWKTLTSAVEYARKVAGANGRTDPLFGIATNGVMSAACREYVAQTFPTVTLSFDGPPDIQNEMRPRADGSGSFDDVMALVEVMRRHKTTYIIRSTITSSNVRRMAEMVDFFVCQTGCKQLHFEPAFLSGRCRSLLSGVPDPQVFATEFIRAMDRGRKLEATVKFSAARLMGVFSSFCGCAQDPFNVTPEGDLTGCFEVCDALNPLADTYHFGHFDAEARRFVIDAGRLAHLRSLTVENKPLCVRCFAKWNCSGDCPIKSLHPFATADSESPRCEMIQTITRALLEYALEPVPCPAT